MENLSNNDNENENLEETPAKKGKKSSKKFKILFVIISILLLIGIICVANIIQKDDETPSHDVEQNESPENTPVAEEDNTPPVVDENTNDAQPEDNNNNTVEDNKEDEQNLTPLSGLGDIFKNANAMVIGDSTAEGLSAYQVLYEENVVWTRGRVIQYMEADLDRVIATQPAILFLSYGANDLLSWNGNVEGYIGAYETVIADLRSMLPNTRICINGILPVSQKALENNPAYGYRDEFNARLKELCEQNDILFIDNAYILEQNDDGNTFEGDGVHPRPFYYRIWASNMARKSGIAN